jgi:hypothetical protein
MSRGLYEMLRLSREEVGQLRHENERLQTINAELLAALEIARDRFPMFTNKDLWHRKNIDAAIAKAKGKQ